MPQHYKNNVKLLVLDEFKEFNKMFPRILDLQKECEKQLSLKTIFKFHEMKEFKNKSLPETTRV